MNFIEASAPPSHPPDSGMQWKQGKKDNWYQVLSSAPEKKDDQPQKKEEDTSKSKLVEVSHDEELFDDIINDPKKYSNKLAKGGRGKSYVFDDFIIKFSGSLGETSYNEDTLNRITKIQNELADNISGIPHVIKQDEFNALIVEKVPGKSIMYKENEYTNEQKLFIRDEVSKIIGKIADLGYNYWDTNPQNIRFDEINNKVYLIDFDDVRISEPHDAYSTKEEKVKKIYDNITNELQIEEPRQKESFKEGTTQPKHAPASGMKWKQGGKGSWYQVKSDTKNVQDKDKAKEPKPKDGFSGQSGIKEQINQIMDISQNEKQKKYYAKQLNSMETRKMQELTVGERSMLDEIVGSTVEPVARQCYANSQRMVIEASFMFPDADVKYVEGFYMFKDMPFMIDHAWVSVNGKDFDPTLAYTGRGGQEVEYHGKTYTVKEVMENVSKTEMYQSISRQKFIDEIEGEEKSNKTEKYLYQEAKIKDSIKKANNSLSKEDVKEMRKVINEFSAGNVTINKYSDGNGNYTPERKKLHDNIIEKMLAGKTKSKNQEVYFLAGVPGSGKTSAARKTIPNMEDFITISGDDIKAKLPEYQKSPMNAQLVHAESRDITKRLLEEAMKKKLNFIYDGTNKTYKQALRRVQKLKGKGYKVRLIGTQLPIHKSIDRASERMKKTGRFIPYDIIRDEGRKINNSIKLLKTAVDGYRIYNTDVPLGEDPRRVEKLIMEITVLSNEIEMHLNRNGGMKNANGRI